MNGSKNVTLGGLGVGAKVVGTGLRADSGDRRQETGNRRRRGEWGIRRKGD